MGNFVFFDRSAVEMYHYTFVRKNMERKFNSVSNKVNYTNGEEFLKAYGTWTKADGPIHPHQFVSKIFSDIVETPNYFAIDLEAQCDKCARETQTRCNACSRLFCKDAHHVCGAMKK